MRRPAKNLSLDNQLPRLTSDPITPLTRSRSTDHLHKSFVTNYAIMQQIKKKWVYVQNYVQEERKGEE
jgi:hypothetical protein